MVQELRAVRIAGAMFCVAIPFVFVNQLTRGHKFAIVILCILLALIHFALQVLVATVMVFDREMPGQGRLTFCVYATLGIGVIVGSISAVMTSVAYYFLRAEKEGTSAEELSAVFG